MLSRRLATLVTIVVVVAFVVVAVAPAFAAGSPATLPMHARLASATPADGATVQTTGEVVLTFTQDVNPDFVDVVVTGPDGPETQGNPAVEGRAVTQRLAGALPAGRHEVTYRVVSADGHPVAGTMTFSTTAAPASASTTVTASGAASVTPSPTPASATPAATTAPVSDDDGDGLPWPVIALVGIVVAAVLGAVLRLLTRARHGSDEGRPPPA